MTSFEIEGDLQAAQEGAIEVKVSFADGQDRWCFFMTPAALAKCGDWIPGSRVRLHLGVPHMFVVSDISETIIRQTLALVANQEPGGVFAHTAPMS